MAQEKYVTRGEVAQMLLEVGLNVAIHSDFSVTEPDLGWLYYSAVTRTLPQKIFDLWYEDMDEYVRTTDPEVTSKNGEFIIGPLKPYDEAIKLADIVRASTYCGAYANFMENEIGSIEKGKKADLIILDQNIFESDIEDVANLKIKTTIFDGKVVRLKTFFRKFNLQICPIAFRYSRVGKNSNNIYN